MRRSARWPGTVDQVSKYLLGCRVAALRDFLLELKRLNKAIRHQQKKLRKL